MFFLDLQLDSQFRFIKLLTNIIICFCAFTFCYHSILFIDGTVKIVSTIKHWGKPVHLFRTHSFISGRIWINSHYCSYNKFNLTPFLQRKPEPLGIKYFLNYRQIVSKCFTDSVCDTECFTLEKDHCTEYRSFNQLNDKQPKWAIIGNWVIWSSLRKLQLHIYTHNSLKDIMVVFII